MCARCGSSRRTCTSGSRVSWRRWLGSPAGLSPCGGRCAPASRFRLPSCRSESAHADPGEAGMATDIAKIRNIAFVGHGGVGKTSLVEAILFAAGAITRLGRVDDGTTTTDFDPDEIKRKISLNTSVAFCDWKGYRLNLVDTPGYGDFVADARAGLRVSARRSWWSMPWRGRRSRPRRS